MEEKQNMDKELTLGSLFSGSGGFELAGALAGIRPVWKSEIEPLPVLVTTKRFPAVKHYGDISTLNGAELPPVDIITFGSPCQDMSIAGKRDGLDGSRSSLFYEAIRIVREMRCATNGEKPRFICWENVPGAFSSNKGEDFKAVLESVIRIKEPAAEVPAPGKKGWPPADYYVGDGWSIAYRVLDAQWWGVPQRRARIFLVADLGGTSAAKILFESESMSGYTPEGFRPWEGAAGGAAESVGAAGGADAGIRGGLILNDQGGDRMDVTADVTSTLRAEAHHPPVVVDEVAAAGFCTEHSAKARSIGYQEEVSPTLRADVVPAAVALDFNPTDSRIKIAEDGKMQTVTRRWGTGGNTAGLVMMPGNVPVTLKLRGGIAGGGKGPIWQQDQSATLGCNNDQTVFVPYGICSKASHAMLSDNPHSGFYEAETSRTLDGNGGSPLCSQGGIAVVEQHNDGQRDAIPFAANQRDEVRDLGDKSAALAAEPGMKQQTFVAEAKAEDLTAFHVNQRDEVIDLHGKSGALMATQNNQMQTYVLQGNMIGREDKNGPQGSGVNEDISFTLDAADRHAVAYPAYCMTTGEYTQVAEEKTPTLMARDYKDPPVVAREESPPPEPYYIVRRLTPLECCRLQGFPDWWCGGLETPDPTPKEIEFWTDVFETHRRVVSGASKPKTEKQIRKWLADPYSDSAIYRMWGNGVALPCVYFVMCGIAWAAGLPDGDVLDKELLEE